MSELKTSYQEQIMTVAHVEHQRDYFVAVRDCFTIQRLEGEIEQQEKRMEQSDVAYTKEFIALQTEPFKNEISSILSKYNLKP